MSIQARLLVAASIGLVSAVACSDRGTGVSDPIPMATAEAIAAFIVDIDGTAGWSASVVADQKTGSREFSQTTSCPAGGTRSVSGSGTSSLDLATRVMSTQWVTTQSQTACAFTNTRGGQTATSVIDGKVAATGSASYQLPATLPGERSIVSYSSKRVGSTTTRIGDRTRTSEVAVTETWADGNFRVVGVVCGREVDITRSPVGKRDA
jgi:hypothetical protein